MKYSDDVESRQRRDPDIEINVQAPHSQPQPQPQSSTTWSGVAYNPSFAPSVSSPSLNSTIRPVHSNATNFEFDFRGDPRAHPLPAPPQSGTSTPDSRPTLRDAGRMTPTYPPRPALGIYPAPSKYDSRTNSELYSRSESAMSSRVGSPGQNWVSDSRFGSQSNLISRSGTPTPPKSEYPLGEYINNSSSTVFNRDWKRDGSIVKINDRDDIDLMPTWKRWLFNTTPLFVLLSLITYWTYFTLRIVCVISAQRQQHQTYPLAWVFIAVELSVAIPTFLHLFMVMFILNPRRRPKLRLLGDDVPAVDVFITCCKEETELVLDTVRAACELDYPLDRFRVVVLDDGRDTDLQEEVEALSERYPNVYYRCREKIPGKPHHFKAGNLNYGFAEVTRMPGGASHFAAALDADMIPEAHWLRAVMPHMLNDQKMALACPPQLFYNVPKEDPLCQSLDFFVHVLEGIKDALGVAWCTGSGYVLRREALEDIGMFPLGSLAEDVATSTLMLGKGWKTAFIHEPLQFGTVPDSFGAHLKQRTRWAIGTVDTAFKLKFCLYGEAVRKMTFFQRLSGFIYAILSLFNVFLAMSLFAMPIVLISGKPLVAYANEEQLRWLIRACFGALLVNRVSEIVMFLPAGYSIGQNGARSQIWMSPYIALTLIRTFVLPTWLGGEVQAFQPSGSLRSDLNERDPLLRAGVMTRVRVIVFNYFAWYHIFYAYFCLTAVTLTTSRCVVENFNLFDRMHCLLTHAFWPPISWIIVVSAFWVPISYAINPPSVPPREELLDRDPKTGVARPKESAKKVAFGSQRTIFEVEYTVMTLFTIFIFIAAFIWL